jgi:hypothetical protein
MSGSGEVFYQSFEYVMVIAVPIFCLTVVALTDQIFALVSRSIGNATKGRRYR